MKTVIFSDTHFNQDFQMDRFEYLVSLIRSYDQIVINGDFWDGYWFSFEDFLQSRWSLLFPELKKKHTIYIYGNHDKRDWQDDRVELFSDIAQEEIDLDLLSNGKTLHIAHGDKYTKHFGNKVADSDRLLRLFLPYYGLRLKVEDKIGARYGWKKDLLNQKIRASKDNAMIMEKMREDIDEDKILVMSHTHSPFYAPDRGYVNTGNINFHLASYIHIEDGEMELIYDTY